MGDLVCNVFYILLQLSLDHKQYLVQGGSSATSYFMNAMLYKLEFSCNSNREPEKTQ